MRKRRRRKVKAQPEQNAMCNAAEMDRRDPLDGALLGEIKATPQQPEVRTTPAVLLGGANRWRV